ncbi:60s Acidic ribosomal protein [Rhizoctonia solani]|uniref:60s Acidic ribosomal protein n=1 Tax=Rhizoctonia solani TaxID=456999 RepID=A0A8H7M2X1_9AGAM|nr:60s Acidic ribosomal protein [Rhizoctonia solani]
MASAELAATYAALALADASHEITSEKIIALTSAAGIELEPIWATLLAKALEGKNVKDLLSNVGGGGAPAAGAAAPAAAAAGGAAPQKQRKRRRRRRRRRSQTMTWVSVSSIDLLTYLPPSLCLWPPSIVLSSIPKFITLLVNFNPSTFKHFAMLSDGSNIHTKQAVALRMSIDSVVNFSG